MKIHRDIGSIPAYVIITAARNERRFIHLTLDSVVAQTLQPRRWVIVNDGSTDGTENVVQRYAETHHFIHLVQVAPNTRRSFQSKAIALKASAPLLAGLKYGFIANLDADVSLCSDYFERVLKFFDLDPALGIGGGVRMDPEGGTWVMPHSNTLWSVSGAIQVFRRECFEDIGGYMPLKMGGIDSMAEVTARMNGWHVRAYPELVVYHHKRTGGSVSQLRAAYQLGAQEYVNGSHLFFEILRCLASVADKPRLLSSCTRMGGYIWHLVRRKQKAVPDEVVRFVQREQILRIARFLRRRQPYEYPFAPATGKKIC